MKRTIFTCMVSALLAAGGLATANGQDPVVPITPIPQSSGAAVSSGTVYDGGTVYSGTVVSGGGVVSDQSGRHADEKRIQGIRHMPQEIRQGIHPRPIYAHSRAGARSTWTHNWNEQQAMMTPWHGGYYHYQYGAPLALITPPTAAFQTNYSWGVGRTTSTPIYHQFARPYPGQATGGPHGLQRTPHWPSNTNQFGVYYIRGPW